jgi:hypothetical protein
MVRKMPDTEEAINYIWTKMRPIAETLGTEAERRIFINEIGRRYHLPAEAVERLQALASRDLPAISTIGGSGPIRQTRIFGADWQDIAILRGIPGLRVVRLTYAIEMTKTEPKDGGKAELRARIERLLGEDSLAPDAELEIIADAHSGEEGIIDVAIEAPTMIPGWDRD